MTLAYDLPRRLAAEALGTALLVATVVGSGIMAQSLTADVALMLLGNTVATGAVLVVLITTLGPISGAHFNPAISLVFALRRELPAREAGLYAAAQLAGRIAGAVTGVFKNQVDWLPLEIGAVRPTQGRTLAVMQVSGGSQSFNAVNTLRLLARWMRMFTIPNQSSVPKAYEQFDDAGRMKPGPLYDRVVDVMEELVRFTWLTRDRAGTLVDRYSERATAAAKLPADL